MSDTLLKSTLPVTQRRGVLVKRKGVICLKAKRTSRQVKCKCIVCVSNGIKQDRIGGLREG